MGHDLDQDVTPLARIPSEAPPEAVASPPREAGSAAEVPEPEALVEEVSIDGMCGVY